MAVARVDTALVTRRRRLVGHDVVRARSTQFAIVTRSSGPRRVFGSTSTALLRGECRLRRAGVNRGDGFVKGTWIGCREHLAKKIELSVAEVAMTRGAGKGALGSRGTVGARTRRNILVNWCPSNRRRCSTTKFDKELCTLPPKRILRAHILDRSELSRRRARRSIATRRRQTIEDVMIRRLEPLELFDAARKLFDSLELTLQRALLHTNPRRNPKLTTTPRRRTVRMPLGLADATPPRLLFLLNSSTHGTTHRSSSRGRQRRSIIGGIRHAIFSWNGRTRVRSGWESLDAVKRTGGAIELRAR